MLAPPLWLLSGVSLALPLGKQMEGTISFAALANYISLIKSLNSNL